MLHKLSACLMFALISVLPFTAEAQSGDSGSTMSGQNSMRQSSTGHQTTSSGQPMSASMTPVMFVLQARMGNQFEIDSSTLALDRSQNDSVKQFAQRMVNDHDRVGSQLNDIVDNNDQLQEMVSQQRDRQRQANANAAQNQSAQSNENSSSDRDLSPAQQQVMQRLRTLNGPEFDREFLSAQRQAHQQAITLYSNFAQNGSDQTLKSFASQTLPALQEHQRMLSQIKLP